MSYECICDHPHSVVWIVHDMLLNSTYTYIHIFSSFFPTRHPTWVLGAFSVGIKEPGHVADPSRRPNARIKNVWSHTSIVPYAFKAFFCIFNVHLLINDQNPLLERPYDLQLWYTITWCTLSYTVPFQFHSCL
jgi:hypothetical protein